MVRSVTVREPEFDARERALMVAAKRYKAGLNRFGIPWEEATDPANQMVNPFEAYVVTDYSEKTFEDQKAAHYAKYPDSSKSGHMWNVRRKRG